VWPAGRRARWQRSAWDERSRSWDEQVSSSAFRMVRECVLQRARCAASDRCVDLGAGTGFLTMAVAERAAQVLAVDVSPVMLTVLRQAAAAQGLENVTTLVADMTALTLEPASLDLVVSSYALHSLPHADKARLLSMCARSLRPGGRIVIADMMLGRGLGARDRVILLDKVRRLARLGVPGLWRIARNVVRLGLGVGENRPATPAWWVRALGEAGFVDVVHSDVVAEAGVVSGVRP